MWESPIKAYVADMVTQMHKQEEEQVMLSITQYMGCDIDKEELIKALNYDREQYGKGFKDGKIKILDKVKQAKEEIENINPVYLTIGDRIPVLKNCDDIKAEVLEILDKLIAESE